MKKDKLEDERQVLLVAQVFLFLGLLVSGILIVFGFAQDDPINWGMVVGGVILALGSLPVWGVLLMLSNISTTLKNEYSKGESSKDALDDTSVLREDALDDTSVLREDALDDTSVLRENALNNTSVFKRGCLNDTPVLRRGDKVMDSQTGEVFYIGEYTNGEYKCYSNKELSIFCNSFDPQRLLLL